MTVFASLSPVSSAKTSSTPPQSLIIGKGAGGEFLFASFHSLNLQPETFKGIQSRLSASASRRSAASLT